MLQIPAEYDSDTSSAKFKDISRQVPPCLATRFFAGICQRALVDESGMIRTLMETHSRSEYGRSGWDALHDTTV
jgi:hypothetical protein